MARPSPASARAVTADFLARCRAARKEPIDALRYE
jgi:hypothetical protein